MPENRTSGIDRRRLLRDAAVGTAAVSAGGLAAAALTTPAQAARRPPRRSPPAPADAVARSVSAGGVRPAGGSTSATGRSWSTPT
ncbi:hypothetical protein [Micromonospora sp. ATA51]|uniref:hypothetical protein n=1 Tax=Micromonospora sp. ATA51 TaxID=2806098 RepID=UPI001EE3CE90|nr:hypothetical protein [Micromonospora sp. ATA51]